MHLNRNYSGRVTLFSYVRCILCKKKTKKQKQQRQNKENQKTTTNSVFFFITFSFSLLQPIEASSTDLAKQKEIEREKEELMDEGDFLEYKVNEVEFSKTCCKSKRSH